MGEALTGLFQLCASTSSLVMPQVCSGELATSRVSTWVSKSYQGKLSLQVCLVTSGVLLEPPSTDRLFCILLL